MERDKKTKNKFVIMVDKLKEFSRRCVNRLIHRYIIVSIAAFLLSHYWIFNNPNNISDNRLLFAIVALAFIAFFLGKHNAMHSCFICIGFLVSMLFYGEKHFFNIFDYQYKIPTLSLNIVVAWIGMAIPLAMLLLSYFSTYKLKKMHKPMKKKDLYYERRDKFDAFSNYMISHNAVGINSPYGNGKSTFVETLKSQQKNWEFITISLLSTTVENVEFCIVREIERVLETYGIYSNPISKIKSFFSHDFSYCIGELLFEDLSYEDQIKKFVDDIRSLKKVIVLNFEDIDRIKNKEHINKIFAICDSLLKYESMFPAENRFIKVIYQCNINALNDMFIDESRERHYVEKFIPYAFFLEPLADGFFKDVLDKNQEKFKSIKNIQFDFLNDNLKHDILQQKVSPSFSSHSIRGVEQVLDNANWIFERNQDLSVSKKQDVEPVIIFYIAKYFFPHIYELLDENFGMVYQKIFYDKEEKLISFADLWDSFLTQKENEKSVYNAKSFRSVQVDFFNERINKKFKENREALLFLNLLGYNDEFFNKKSNTAEKFNEMNRKEEILNRLIRLS